MKKTTYAVKIGNKIIGNNNPIIIQSMTNTDTSDVASTTQQIIDLTNAGAEIVRITVNDSNAAKSVAEIKNLLIQKNISTPIVGCFHYNGHTLLNDYKDMAQALDKYRINPGNVGFGNKKDLNFEKIINQAINYNKPIRIGVNWGSLDQKLTAKLMDENLKQKKPLSNEEILIKALINSTITSATFAEELGINKNKIVLSCKVSNTQHLINIYKTISKTTDYALHLGLTEAGSGLKGIVSTTAAISTLLQMGIGDTIRASITPKIGEPRSQEVKLCQEILQALEIRKFSPQIISCPGCGRTTSTYFQQLASDIQNHIDKSLPIWKKQYKDIEKLNIAVMGCIVNGPGESKHANIGISLPGNGESPVAPVFIDGIKSHTLRGENILKDFIQIIDQYIQNKYSA